MSNIIKVYGIDMSDFDTGEYIESLSHDPECPVEISRQALGRDNIHGFTNISYDGDKIVVSSVEGTIL